VLFGPSKNEARKRSISESYAEHPIHRGEFKPMTLHEEIKKLRETVQSRDDEITKLKHEIHKLKVSLEWEKN
jgi:predicted RNase H-like nuclease (RuvC/YqgF family)